jgi:glucose-1-phosphate cytidylyltransferase
MKVVILAGGYGTRLSEETDVKPKPMVEIGGMPILWHVMKIYSHYGFNEFLICLGYKGFIIKQFFDHYFLHESDVTFDFSKGNERITHRHSVEPWKVTLVDTGLNTMTGGRVRRIQRYLKNETFMLTYGDGIADVNISKLLKFHKSHGKKVTVTAVQPAGRFGVIDIDANNGVSNFWEKPKTDASWVSGGFFVMEPGIFGHIKDDRTILEKTSLIAIAKEGELKAYKHSGFWQCMDKLSDKMLLEELWNSGKAPWRVWNKKKHD